MSATTWGTSWGGSTGAWLASWAQTLLSIPDVVGETQAQGTTDLENAGFTVSVVTAYSATVLAGLVISQQPAGGSQAASGTLVTLTVSLGAQPNTGQAVGAGGGGGYHKPRLGKHPLRKQLDEILDSAEDAYRALLESRDAPAAAKIVKPFAEDKRLAIPPVSTIDWAALERDATRTRRLIAMAAKLELRREIDEDDDEFMLFH